MGRSSYNTHTPKTLEAIIGLLDEASAKLKAYVTAMEQLEIEAMKVRGEIDRGLESIAKFGDNTGEAIRREMRERGVFGKDE